MIQAPNEFSIPNGVTDEAVWLPLKILLFGNADEFKSMS